MKTLRVLLIAFGPLMAATTLAMAQAFPERPAKVVMPYPAETHLDTVTRSGVARAGQGD